MFFPLSLTYKVAHDIFPEVKTARLSGWGGIRTHNQVEISPHSFFFSKEALRNRDFFENLFYAILSEKEAHVKKVFWNKI
jgi:hypothetical protein